MIVENGRHYIMLPYCDYDFMLKQVVESASITSGIPVIDLDAQYNIFDGNNDFYTQDYREAVAKYRDLRRIDNTTYIAIIVKGIWEETDPEPLYERYVRMWDSFSRARYGARDTTRSH